MIRKHTECDLKDIVDVWYQSSTKAHPFLTTEFVERVKSDMTNIYIPGSNTWVFEQNNTIVGFISMIENEIGGLFVLPGNQAKGVGSKLVDHMRLSYPAMEVEVFEKNVIGRRFYKKYGFNQIGTYDHEETGEKVLRLRIEH